MFDTSIVKVKSRTEKLYHVWWRQDPGVGFETWKLEIKSERN